MGKPIRVDFNTINVECGRFARVYAEIDLSLSVIGKIYVMRHWQNMECDGLHIICLNCGLYDHTRPNVLMRSQVT